MYDPILTRKIGIPQDPLPAQPLPVGDFASFWKRKAEDAQAQQGDAARVSALAPQLYRHTGAPPSGWSPTQLNPEQQVAFERDMRQLPWYTQMTTQLGREPDLSPASGYDYAGAWAANAMPSVYEGDGQYHWSSRGPQGQWFKSPDHPTAWMEMFMNRYGVDPGTSPEIEGDIGRAIDWANKRKVMDGQIKALGQENNNLLKTAPPYRFR